MRAVALAASVTALAATSLLAQATPRDTTRHPAPMLQTATFDVAGAFDEHWRGAIEPLVFSRFAIGISGALTTQAEQPVYGILYPAPCPVNTLCAGGASADDGSSYKAWSLNVHARWYPAALSSGGRRQAAGLYIGEFIGYSERRIQQPIYYGCPNCYYPPPQDSSVIYPPQPPPVGNSWYTQLLHGWEPGVEAGVRIITMRHLVIDVGGRFRLATIDDPYSGVRPGGVDSRLVVALGAGW